MSTITEFPLQSIYRDEKEIAAKRIRHLSEDDIASLLSTEKLIFATAEIGKELEWHDAEEAKTFFDQQVKYRVAYPDEEIFLDDFPENYCYVASEWSPFPEGYLILLEKIE